MQNAYEPSKLAWRVLWRTIAFYIVAFAALGIGGQLSLAMVNLRANALGFIVIILEYWPIFLLIYYPRWRSSSRGQQNLTGKDATQHSWRVWGAWFGVTALIIWSVIEWHSDWAFAVFLYFFIGGPLWLPPIATIIGALVGDLLLRSRRVREL